jgi:hypothetical protein
MSKDLTKEQISAYIKMHERKIAALSLLVDSHARLVAHKEANLFAIHDAMSEALKMIERQTDLLFLLESGDIQAYAEIEL